MAVGIGTLVMNPRGHWYLLQMNGIILCRLDVERMVVSIKVQRVRFQEVLFETSDAHKSEPIFMKELTI